MQCFYHDFRSQETKKLKKGIHEKGVSLETELPGFGQDVLGLPKTNK